MRIQPIILLLLFIFSAGCASTNTFQTPDVLKPGRALVGAGGSLPLIKDKPGSSTEHLHPLVVYLRVGVIERVDLGLRMDGTGASFDAKFQFMKTSELDGSLSVGIGRGSHRKSCLYDACRLDDGNLTLQTRSFFAGIVIGGEGFYGGVKVINYKAHWTSSSSRDSTNPSSKEFIPAITLGMRASTRRFVPITELNLYIGDKIVPMLSFGFQIR